MKHQDKGLTLWLGILVLLELGLVPAFIWQQALGEIELLLLWLALLLVTSVFAVLVVRDRRRLLQKLSALKGQNSSLTEERVLIESVLTNIRAAEDFDDRGIDYLLESVENTAGDILLAARRPDGVRHYLIGDFTGHGLTSAMASPTVADIFYSMTKKGMDPPSILRETNVKLCSKLPANIFLAAAFIEVNEKDCELRVWNAGLPDQLVLRDHGPWQRLASDALPLGIVEDWMPEEVVELDIQMGDTIYAFSDGVIEVSKDNGELFGIDRLEMELCRISHEQRPLSSLLGTLASFGGKPKHGDDISLLEIRVGRSPVEN